jgi:WD40 repeat protein
MGPRKIATSIDPSSAPLTTAGPVTRLDAGAAVAQKNASFTVSDEVSALAFSPDARYLALTTYKVPTTSTVAIWSWRSPSRLVRTFDAGENPGSVVNRVALTYSPDGRLLALVHDVDSTQPGQHQSRSSVIRAWNLQSGAQVFEIHDSTAGATIPALQFAANGRALYALNDRQAPGNQLVSYRPEDGQTAWGLRASTPFDPQTLSLSPDGQYIALGGLVAAPRTPMHAPLLIVDATRRAIALEINAFGAEANIGGLAWSPDGTRIAAGASVFNVLPGVQTIKVFDAKTGIQVAGAPAPDQKIAGIVYVRGGKYLAEVGNSGSTTIWDPGLKLILQTLPTGRGPLAVSSDGRYLAVASGTTISVWEFL